MPDPRPRPAAPDHGAPSRTTPNRTTAHRTGDAQAGAAPPQPGDVLLACRPGRGARADRTEFRPVLVLETVQRTGADGATRVALTVADSFAGKLDRCFPGEFAVEAPDSLAAAGMRRPAKFDTGRPAELAYDRNAFVFGRQGDPRLGRLPEAEMDRARAAYAGACARLPDVPEIAGLAPRPPKPGDVVWLHSPYDEAPDRPSAKPHPCLVTATWQVRDAEGRTRTMVRHVPGTSQQLFRRRPGDFHVEEPARLEAVGLARPTKFKLAQEKTVPWAPRYVPQRRTGAVLGRFGAPETAAFKAARAELEAIATQPGPVRSDPATRPAPARVAQAE